MDNNKIGKFIAACRKEKGLTQQELGDRLFVTDKAVSKWERGISFPDITILEKLAKELDVDISEILCGKKGKGQKIDIQSEIDKRVLAITEKQKQLKIKKQKKIKIISIIFLTLMIILSFIFYFHYKHYHPDVINMGNNNYELGLIGISNLEKDGLDKFITAMEKTEKVKNLNSNIAYFNVELTKNGNIKNLLMTIYYFDKDYKYTGSGYYIYKNKNLEFKYEDVDDCSDVTTCEINKTLVTEYSKSLNIKYINTQIKKIPFNKQIKLSNLKNYKVAIYPNQQFSSPTSIFDMRDNKDIKALNLKDYKAGKGGTIESGIYPVITLSDGSSTIADEIYTYVFDNVDGDIKKVDNTMETDYYINSKNKLLFTRDYGNKWIETDLKESELKETLNFYRSLSFPNSSWFIATNELIPIAYFYGENPRLKISTDNGATWEEITFDIDNYKSIPHRIVGFNNQNFGYVALGTDWTMGSGEYKNAYITKNGGKDWTPLELPFNHTSQTLKDFIMYDENIGLTLLYNYEDNEFPSLYLTLNKGKSWQEIAYKKLIPEDVTYITNIDSIEKKNNEYFLVLSEGDNTTTKVKLKSNDLINWQYDSTFTSSIHTVG